MYISYLRVSTDKQKRSGLGLEAQRSIVEHYAKIEKTEIIKEVIEVESGKDTGIRPLLLSAVEECREKGYTLIVAKLDRLSRDVQDTFLLIKMLDGRLKSCDIPVLDSFTLAIFAGLAQRERELISIRTKQALAEKKKQGIKLGSPKNLTIEARLKGSAVAKLKSDSFRQNKILLAYVEKCVRDGKNCTEIASELNEMKFRTVRGREYSYNSVQALINEIERPN